MIHASLTWDRPISPAVIERPEWVEMVRSDPCPSVSLHRVQDLACLLAHVGLHGPGYARRHAGREAVLALKQSEKKLMTLRALAFSH
jgi:hypothetical protein